MPGGRTRGQPHGAVGASPSLLALSTCVEKNDMLEYQRSSALLERPGAAATKIDKGSRCPCTCRPPAYVCATCDEGGQGEKMETDGGRGLKKKGGIGAGGGGGLSVRSSAGQGREKRTSDVDLEQLEPLERT